MTKLGSIIDTIKEIECPVDEFEDKLKSAYREYVGSDCNIIIERKSASDTLGLKAYEIYTRDCDYYAICVMVREGEEHYVSNVQDAYLVQ